MNLSPLLLLLTVLLLAIMSMRWVSDRLDQPSVLGELLLGVAIGNVGVWLGYPFFEIVMNPAAAAATPESSEAASHTATIFHALAELGAILLLFSAGLESSVTRMKQVGGQAMSVAAVGVIAPFALAYITCIVLHEQMSIAGHLFLAATLSATSVGITASVLKDLRVLGRRESEVILGAAVIDDVLGLVLLAVVSRIAATAGFSIWQIAATLGTAILFVGAVILLGERIAARGTSLFRKLDRSNGLFLFPLALAFGFAWLAESIGLAAIVGAFAAGLVLTDQMTPATTTSTDDEPTTTVSHLLAPLERFLAPIFFLYVGMQVNVSYVLDARTLALALLFTVCAIIGKLVAGLAAGRCADRLAVGIGMVPRGEVGLVFLGVGRGLGVVSDSLFAALLVVVFATTVITPPLLKWAFRDQRTSQTTTP